MTTHRTIYHGKPDKTVVFVSEQRRKQLRIEALIKKAGIQVITDKDYKR